MVIPHILHREESNSSGIYERDTHFIHYNGRQMSFDDFKGFRGEEPMNLVLCFDGTRNEFGIEPYTNVLKLFRILDKENTAQLCYYQPGLGITFKNEVSFHSSNLLRKCLSSICNMLDTVSGFTLSNHVVAAYIFLMRFYSPRANIHLFGFSRGSFIARVLAGMIERVGLLNNGLEEMVSTAWDLYTDWEFAGQPAQPDITTSLIDEFKDTFCRRNVKIHFMGLWDSVNSIGLFNDRMFPYTVRSSIVSHIRHAVSVDERRGKYKQVSFEPLAQNYNDSIRSAYESQSNNQLDQYTSSTTGTPYSARSPLLGDSKRLGGTSIWSQLKNLFTGSSHRECERFSEDILELWFPGNHGDVGGGWPPDLDGQYLSDIPLRWMILEALKFGVKFKENELQDFHFKHPVEASLLSCHHDMLALRRKMPMLHPSPRRFNWFKKLVKKTHKRNTLSQENIEISPVTSHSDEVSFTPQIKIIKHLPKKPKAKFDAMGDLCTLVPLFWWLIELLPIGIKLEGDNRKWKKVYSPNLGRRRKLPKVAVLHWSVLYRMHYIDDYNPPNLPVDVGSLAANLLAPFRSMYSDDEWEYISNLTKDQIKGDWNTPIWNTVPDDLFGFI